jgi:hypothetical protein
MPPHLQPGNDAAPMGLREALEMSLRIPEPEVVAATCANAPTSIAWDEAAACLAKGDFAGHDAAMRIFRKLVGRL